MTEQPPDRREQGAPRREQGNGTDRGRGNSGAYRAPAVEEWERRAAGLASGVQRWLIKTSARNMRDELSDQVRKAFRGQQRDAGDVWATATTEPPGAAVNAPECAWCPVCRAARRIAESRAETGPGGGSVLAEAADVVAGAVRDALASIDSVLSYRPGEGRSAPAGDARADDARAGDAGADDARVGDAAGRPAHGANGAREPADEPDHRG